VVELSNEEIAVVPPLPEGSSELAEATAEAAAKGARLIIWRGHGAVALDETLHEAILLLEHAEEEAELQVE
jgi:ribulose-5-phosphate 4-epimerase/fuculose-1-phosphate aldolase